MKVCWQVFCAPYALYAVLLARDSSCQELGAGEDLVQASAALLTESRMLDQMATRLGSLTYPEFETERLVWPEQSAYRRLVAPLLLL